MKARKVKARKRSLVLALFCLALLGTASHAVAEEPVLEEFDKYQLESASVGLSTPQAGAHADLTIAFGLTENGGLPYATTRDVETKLPPGMIGDPQAVERCSVADFGIKPEDSHCPFDTQVGITEVKVGGVLSQKFTEPVYNMEPPRGGNVIARFGFYADLYPTFLNVRIDPSDYSVVATVEGAPSAARLISARSIIWGVPADPAHDEDRMTVLEAAESKKPAGGRPAGVPEAPFLSNPTDCTLQRQVTITVRSYQQPDAPRSRTVPFPDISGCGRLGFAPRFQVAPTNPEAFAPTGLDTELVIPQDETPHGLATSTLKSATVTLPEGFAVNPAAGDGLQACSSTEVGFGENSPAACPAAAKIGSAEVDVPALELPLHGSVYQRTPEPGHQFRFWLVTDEQGVHLKLPAEIQANPLTGQLTTRFSGIPTLGGLPQVPFSNLKLHVFGGPRAPLATPGCGTYQTQFEFVPWSGGRAAAGAVPMQIVSGCGKGGFSPRLRAGTLNSGAGTFSPFTMTLTRSDGEPNPQSLGIHLPQGLLAKLRGVPVCPAGPAATGSCPAGSRIGSLTTSAGVGGAPLWIPQPGKTPTAVYLGGSYKGAPYSVISVVPAQAGPFDLGTVVNRAGIFIDPETALATIKTDPLPQLLEGVPVSYRTIHVDIDRKDFTLNPTGCRKKKIRATVSASNGLTAEPTDSFQAVNCAKLAYRPKLKLTLHGATKRTGHPALRAVLTQKPHQANTRSATVILPASEFIDQAHISNPCTRVQFDADRCPKGSVLGTVRAVTPLLAKPLKGKVYFRSNGGARELPDIVADLRGAIHITLVGYVDSVHKRGSEVSRVRTRFARVPDAPVTRFTMSLFGGKRGLLVNSRDLCLKGRRVKLQFRAQNDRVRTTNPVIQTGCS